MKQTPAHSVVNNELLSFMPLDCRRVVEIGCMHGVLAKVYRQRNPSAEYIGIDIDPDYAKVAAEVCTDAMAGDIELLPAETFNALFPSDCWVFGDCLEHLRNPWSLVSRIREQIDPGGYLITCVPNAQHWSVQQRLASGNFWYEDSGLLDRTHIRWFTRITLVKMFQDAGWQIENAISRNLNSPHQEQHLKAIGAMAEAVGLDPLLAMQDAAPFQYVFKVRAL